MQKNTASQKVALLAIDVSTNAPKTGDAANLTAYVSKDWGAVTVLGDTTATEMDATNAPGMYMFDLTQSETNADELIFSGKSSTANIRLIPRIIQTVPGSFSTLTIANSCVDADVERFAGTAGTFSGGRPEVNTSHAAGTAWNSGAITSNTFGTDAITSTGLAASAVTEIQSGLSTVTTAQVNAEVDTALADVRLDELLAADSDIDGAAPPTVGSVFHELMTKTTGSFTYDQTTDSLESLRDRGDAAWITAAGFSTHSAADVWSVATRVLTAATNLTSSGAALQLQGDGYAKAQLADGVTHGGTTAKLRLGSSDANHPFYITSTGLADGIRIEATGLARDAIHLESDTGNAMHLVADNGGGIVGSIIGNINGNLSGSVGSVTAAVTLPTIPVDWITSSGLAASAVTEIQSGLATSSALSTLQTSVDDLPTNSELATALGTADDAVLAAIAALNNVSTAQILAQVETALATTTRSLPGQATPSTTPTLTEAIMQLFQQGTNPYDQDDTVQQIYNRAGTVVHQKRTVSELAGTVSIGPLVAGP